MLRSARYSCCAAFTTLVTPVAAVLVVLAAGPVTAALLHCAVTLVRTGNLVLSRRMGRDCASTGGWGSGSVATGAALMALGVLAVRFYGVSSLWPLAFLTVYVLVAARHLPAGPLDACDRGAGPADSRSGTRRRRRVRAARPGATLALGLALLLVNIAGLAAAVMPFLTLTLAYTFLATARFVLPSRILEETV